MKIKETSYRPKFGKIMREKIEYEISPSEINLNSTKHPYSTIIKEREINLPDNLKDELETNWESRNPIRN